MILDYNKMAEKRIERFKDGEGHIMTKMFADDNNRIMATFLPAGSTIGEHTHETSCEVIYILDGSAKAFCDGKEEDLAAGMCHYCPKNSSHTIIAGDEGVRFFAVVPELG